MQPDILLFMSDQHAPQYMGGGEIPVDTPHLDALRREGVEFSQAYTACPLVFLPVWPCYVGCALPELAFSLMWMLCRIPCPRFCIIW